MRRLHTCALVFQRQHVEISYRSLLHTGLKFKRAENCLSLSEKKKNICQRILKCVSSTQSCALCDVIGLTVSLPINQGLETQTQTIKTAEL